MRRAAEALANRALPGRRGARLLATCGLAFATSACKGEPDPFPWCSAGEEAPAPGASSPTYYADVKPFIDQKCVRCHVEGGIGPFALSTFNDVKAHAVDSEGSIVSGRMPPFLAEGCCNTYFQDYSLSAAEIETFRAWNRDGTPEGDAQDEPPPLARIGGVSRADIELKMKEAYTPNPRDGTTDDLRCFILDWPYDEDIFVTGLEPLPGTRDVVHHLIVAAVSGHSVDEIEARDGADGQPGFDCSGGFGDLDIRDIKTLGGSLLGGDFPRGIGHKVEAGSKILLHIHYSTLNGKQADLSAIRLRVDDDATEAKTIPIANPAWLAAGGMDIEAGDRDAKFFYRMEPDLFTQDGTIAIQSITPHMHEFATKLRVLAKHEDGETTCLLEIGSWHFGWEQPFWLDQPLTLGPDDELYLECHFDNSKANQPDGSEPRDIAWGGDNQDMCAAFVSFTEDDE